MSQGKVHKLTQSNAIKINDFELKEILGEGAFSTVYRAIRGNQVFAIKLRKPGLKHSDSNFESRREAAAIALIKHPGIPEAFEAGEADGQSYLIMEYVDGETLASQIEKGVFSEEKLIETGKSIASILAGIHSQGFVHC